MKNNEKKIKVSKFEEIVFSLKSIFSIHRSPDVDEMLVQLKTQRLKAREINAETKATLNGEENWFKLKNGSGEDDANNFK